MIPPKKGIGVMIAVGKEKPGPPDLESPGKPESSPEHEAAETPEYEAREEQGTDILGDLDAVSEAHGMDASMGRSFFREALGAVLKCLGEDTGESSDAEQEAGYGSGQMER